MLLWLYVFIKATKERYFTYLRPISTPTCPPLPFPPVKGYWSGHRHLGIELRGSCAGNTFSMGGRGNSSMVCCHLSVKLWLAVLVSEHLRGTLPPTTLKTCPACHKGAESDVVSQKRPCPRLLALELVCGRERKSSIKRASKIFSGPSKCGSALG